MRSLYSGASTVTEDAPILKRIFDLGEKQLAWFAEELLSNPRVAEAFTRALQKAFETKGRVDRNIQTVLGLLNLPSRGDLNRLATKLEAIQGSLVNLNLKVDRLLSERPRRPRPAPKTADSTGE